ncbi:MAG: hypothetical protein J3Q66DRAFT_421648 [Benniella sp.]|nr:MAG: hypothetical protein J3Q66DRAFT_421648 [Benniella sp.]
MPAAASEETHVKKRRAPLPHEQLFISRLPYAEMNEKSYMPGNALNFVAVTKRRIMASSLSSSTALISGIGASDNGLLLATVSLDKTLNVCDVANFDMITVIRLDLHLAQCAGFIGEAKAAGWRMSLHPPYTYSTVVAMENPSYPSPNFTAEPSQASHPTTNTAAADETGALGDWDPDEEHDLSPHPCDMELGRRLAGGRVIAKSSQQVETQLHSRKTGEPAGSEHKSRKVVILDENFSDNESLYTASAPSAPPSAGHP